MEPLLVGAGLLSSVLLSGGNPVVPQPPSDRTWTNQQTFTVQGVVRELKADGQTIVIRHEAVSNYMDAMTMPFKARNPAELKELRSGDEISFRLHVTETESWIDRISKLRTGRVSDNRPPEYPPVQPAAIPRTRHPLLDFKFTNELGQAVSLNDFRGQALAITFFFTRCPLPDYCPRLSKNFAEASQKLGAMPGASTNWHFLSVSFDTAFDTPAVLKAYGERYHYDPARWSFLTGLTDRINELARLSGVEVKGEAGLFNHNFRTLIIDAGGRLQATFPFGGDLSDAIVAEMLKAAAATNPAAAAAKAGATPGIVSIPAKDANTR